MTATPSARGGRNGASRPSFRPADPTHEPSAPRPGTVQDAQRRRTEHRLAQTPAAGIPLCPIRAALLGFSVRGGDLALACNPTSTRLNRSYGIVSVHTKATCGSFHAQSVRTRAFAGHLATGTVDTGPDALTPRRQRQIHRRPRDP